MKTDHLRHQIIHYLNKYLSKYELKMRPVMEKIINQISSKSKMTRHQFVSIIKFIERDRPYKHLDGPSITSHFSPIIMKPSKGILPYEETNTLEHFLYQPTIRHKVSHTSSS